MKQNGSDKPLRLSYIDDHNLQKFEGPYLYITKLPLHSLLFNPPSSDYNVEIRDFNLNLNESGYYRYKNIEEGIQNLYH